MNDSPNTQHFQQNIYDDLDEKLRATPWKSGVSEAHGLLTGLACKSISTTEIINKIHLFQISERDQALMLEGLFELILRDLKSDQPTFNLLLPDPEKNIVDRAEAIANWCGGFIQGFCYDSDSTIIEYDEDVQELLGDIMDISGLQIVAIKHEDEDEKSLVEIEEYLRVGVQLIYDHCVAVDRIGDTTSNDELH